MRSLRSKPSVAGCSRRAGLSVPHVKFVSEKGSVSAHVREPSASGTYWQRSRSNTLRSSTRSRPSHSRISIDAAGVPSRVTRRDAITGPVLPIVTVAAVGTSGVGAAPQNHSPFVLLATWPNRYAVPPSMSSRPVESCTSEMIEPSDGSTVTR